MLKLSHEECHKFWSNYGDQNLYKVIVSMECAENWTLDTGENKKLEEAINKLEKQLDKLGSAEITNLEAVIKLLSCLKISRVMRILQAIDAANPGGANKVLTKAEEISKTNKDAKLFLSRNLTFERLRLITKVFDKDRIKFLNDAIEGTS
jgi:intracellular multiplication protein IcmW